MNIKLVEINPHQPTPTLFDRFPNTEHQVTTGEGAIPRVAEFGNHEVLSENDLDFFGQIGEAWDVADAEIDLTDKFDANQIVFSSDDNENLAMIKKYDVPRQFGWGFMDNRLHPSIVEKFKTAGRNDLLVKYYACSSMSLYEREAKVLICDAIVDSAGFRDVEDFRKQNKLGNQDESANTLAKIMGKIKDKKLDEVPFETIQYVGKLIENDIAIGNPELGLKILTSLLEHPNSSVGKFSIELANNVDAFKNGSNTATKEAWLLAQKEFHEPASKITEQLLLINDIKQINSNSSSSNSKFMILFLLIALLLGVQYTL